MACELTGTLGEARGALVAAGPVTGDRRVQRGPVLSARLASVVAGALGGDTRAAAGAPGLSSALGLAREQGQLLYLRPRLADGELSVVADLYPARSGFWERVKSRAPLPTAHGYATRRLDPEVRSFLPRAPLVLDRVDKAAGPRQPVSLACGDVTGDGSLELVVSTRHHVHLGRIVDGQFVDIAKTPWRELAPVAPVPLKQPIGAIALPGDGSIEVGITDRTRAVRLSPELGVAAHLPTPLPWPAWGCTGTAAFTLHGPVPCSDASTAELAPIRGADAVAGALVVDDTRHVRRVRGFRRERDSTAVFEDSDGRRVEIEEAGAQLAIADLDLDGAPELLTSTNTLDPELDALVVRTWTANGGLQDRVRMAVPGGIRALAACPPETSAERAVVIATDRELWVAR